jgi:protein-tyrosine phosphatase
LHYFTKSVVLEKKNTMPGKVDKPLQNRAIQGISEQEKFMIRVLFICHGNICRSPMAEFVFKDMVEKRGLADRFEIASAATSTEEIWNGVGNPVYPPAREELAKHGISCEGKRAVQLKKSDYDAYDYLIGMDYMNIKNIERMTGHQGGKIKLLLSFAGEDRPISDPWYTGDFRKTYEDVVKGCEALLRCIDGKTL